LADKSPHLDDLLWQSLAAAWLNREKLLQDLHLEDTDCCRFFHGTVEGRNGVTIDRYGRQLLVQSFHDTLDQAELNLLEAFYRERVPEISALVYHDRSDGNSRQTLTVHRSDDTVESAEELGRELGLVYKVDARHSGQDPLLFLDMRVGRRWMLANARNKSVLNLFAYTCGIGICAAQGGASAVWNVDFAESALAVGQRNAELNHIDPAAIRFIKSDCFPALQQLSGLGIRVRQRKLHNGKVVPILLPDYPKLPERQFDLTFMDPPRWAKSKFGTVDLIRDYQSLFKPALMATAIGGEMIVCNNVAKVDKDEWLAQLIRCGEKIGRTIRLRQWLLPDSDFPTFDGRHPLKIAVLDV
jgi:23S rRNA (cytosine1962-C5)-methyltransferase